MWDRRGKNCSNLCLFDQTMHQKRVINKAYRNQQYICLYSSTQNVSYKIISLCHLVFINLKTIILQPVSSKNFVIIISLSPFESTQIISNSICLQTVIKPSKILLLTNMSLYTHTHTSKIIRKYKSNTCA